MTASKRPSTTRNSLWILISNFSARFFTIVLIVLISRLLGPKVLGQYQLLLNFVFIFTFFTDMGLGQLIVREIGKDRQQAQEMFSHAFMLTLGSSVFFYVCLLIVFHFLNYSPSLEFLMAIAGLTVFSNSLTACLNGVFNGLEIMHIPALWGMFLRLAILSLSLLSILAGYRLSGLVVAMAVAGGLTLLGTIVSFKRLSFRFVTGISWPYLKDILVQLAPFAVLMSLTVIYQRIDIVILSKLSGDLATGYYVAAMRLLEAMMLIPVSIELALQPVIARHSVNSQEAMWHTYRLAVRYLLIIGLPMVIVATFSAGSIIMLLFGTEFEPAAKVLPIIAWAGFTVFIDIPALTILRISPYLWRFTSVVAVNTLFLIGLNFVLIPKYSFIGAGIACLVTKLVDLGAFTYYLRKTADGPLGLVQICRGPLLAGLGMMAVYQVKAYLPEVITIIIVLTVYVSLLRVFVESCEEDKAFVKKVKEKLKLFLPSE